jgi:hypothetical protein
MLDLTGIPKPEDFVVKLYENRDFIEICYKTQLNAAEEIAQDLENAGFNVDINHPLERLKIKCHNIDRVQLAERLALSLENNGYIVTRLTPSPGSRDRSPRRVVQSFVLA